MSMHPTRNLFAEFKTGRIFVETGMWRGDGIQLALDAGFQHIISIDIDPVNVEFCKSRFNIQEPGNLVTKSVHDSSVTLMLGDSAEDLWNVFDWIDDEQATFWLDAHWQMLEGTDPGRHPFPLLDELKQIGRHAVKTHTILIDDMLIMQQDIVGYNNRDIISALYDINPGYRLDRFANPVINNILVAHA